MALAMTRPFKHPRTGIYWLRRRVPKDLVSLVGRQEVTKSLETRDPTEAKQRLVQALAELDARWANLKQGSLTISEREAHAYAVTIYESWLEQNRDEPSFNEFWVIRLFSRLWMDSDNNDGVEFPSGISEQEVEHRLGEVLDNVSLKSMREHCEAKAHEILSKNGLALSASNVWAMARAVGIATHRAALVLDKEAQGIYEPGNEPTTADRLTEESRRGKPNATDIEAPGIQKRTRGEVTVSLKSLVDLWWTEAKATGRKPSTFESYSNTFSNLARFLKHDDAERITTDDVIRFKDYRLNTPSPKTGRPTSAKTVKGTDLTALKTVFGWAVSNRRLSSNPAIGVTLKVNKPARLRSKGFSDDEANAILAAALAYQSDRETPQTAAAKKWVPWLCALTGARVGEMAQLRKQDVYRTGGLWVLRITPEAGTVKNNKFREVVLHRQLIELGFPAFIEASADGPLFLRPSKSAEVLGPLQGLKNRLAEFSRSVVADPNVAPMHGFRHRFKTVGRSVGVDAFTLDAIQGHEPRTSGESYGDVELDTIAEAISKFPDMAAGSKI